MLLRYISAAPHRSHIILPSLVAGFEQEAEDTGVIGRVGGSVGESDMRKIIAQESGRPREVLNPENHG